MALLGKKVYGLRELNKNSELESNYGNMLYNFNNFIIYNSLLKKNKINSFEDLYNIAYNECVELTYNTKNLELILPLGLQKEKV